MCRDIILEPKESQCEHRGHVAEKTRKGAEEELSFWCRTEDATLQAFFLRVILHCFYLFAHIFYVMYVCMHVSVIHVWGGYEVGACVWGTRDFSAVFLSPWPPWFLRQAWDLPIRLGWLTSKPWHPAVSICPVLVLQGCTTTSGYISLKNKAKSKELSQTNNNNKTPHKF